MTTIRCTPIPIPMFTDQQLDEAIENFEDALNDPDCVDAYKDTIRPSYKQVVEERQRRRESK